MSEGRNLKSFASLSDPADDEINPSKITTIAMKKGRRKRKDCAIRRTDKGLRSGASTLRPTDSRFSCLIEVQARCQSDSHGERDNSVCNPRHFVSHRYVDHAQDREQDCTLLSEPGSNICGSTLSTRKIKQISHQHSQQIRAQRARGGVTTPFPIKLHNMLEDPEEHDLASIVSWQVHGRAFLVRKPKDFVEIVMPKFFRQTKITSFQRQLNLYGFRRITKGRDTGAYYHELFLRGKPFLAARMTRTKIKGTGFKAASSPETEPDFYSMQQMVPSPKVKLDEKAMYEYGVGTVAGVLPGIPVAASSPILSPKSKASAMRVAMRKDSARAVLSPNSLNEAPFLPTPVTPESGPIRAHMHSISPVAPSFGASTIPAFPELLECTCTNETSANARQPSTKPTEYQGTDIIVFEGRPFHYLDTSEVCLDSTPSIDKGALLRRSSTVVSDDNIAEGALSSKRFTPISIPKENTSGRWLVDGEDEASRCVIFNEEVWDSEPLPPPPCDPWTL